jgi:DNA-binding NtrC family response regulator
MEKFRIQPTRFTLVLLDLTMPHLDGEETFRQMRMLNPKVRVILTSGFNQQEAITRFTGKGLAGFIQKPFELGSLIQVIRSVLPHN